MSLFQFSGQNLSIEDLQFLLSSKSLKIEFSSELKIRIQKSQDIMMSLFAKGTPIYGVTTGFGDSCHRVIDSTEAHKLQHNLASYLRCGTGDDFSEEVGRLVLRLRTLSLSRGLSGVSLELLEKMSEFSEKEIYPRIPQEGSLGASGDLVPLAYIATMLEGRGPVYHKGVKTSAETLVQEDVISPYELKPKEGLAIVNGTTVMLAQAAANYFAAEKIVSKATTFTAWLCLALEGKVEAFGKTVNQVASRHEGQADVAERITELLRQEDYSPLKGSAVSVTNGITNGFVQDRYSLRCAPQILGPVTETLQMAKKWIEEESNGVSDNPLFGEDFELANGGNFYGGYICHAMDYLKFSLAQVADLMDRQLTLLCDEKVNRGLPPNLSNWNGMNLSERHLHHGLKGIHQAVSAITSEIMAASIPNGIFSRSTESHNQDKVSLGTSAAVQCNRLIQSLWNVTGLYSVAIAQALDLRGRKLKGTESKSEYETIREFVPFIDRDQTTDMEIRKLVARLSNQEVLQ
ncbi:MAG: aromatic amino acid lyase [Bdellovibrionales bacterium]|nr:aromatic amino acid lyase [Bdellovibrionales bacterium]